MGQTNHSRVLAIDCGGTFVKSAIVNSQGEISNISSFPTRTDHGVEKFISDLHNLITGHRQQIIAVGIAFAGPVDSKKGIIIDPPNFPTQWHNLPLVSIMSQRYNLRICMENDASLAALGEYWLGGDGNQTDILAALTLGTGIGGGIVINGKIFNGATGIAGELGHICVASSGPKCGCGSIGCLETFASANAVVRMAKIAVKEGGKPTTLSSLAEIKAIDVYRLGKNGDEVAREIYSTVGIYLGIGIASICHVLGPRKVVLTGGGAGAWELFAPSMQETLRQRCFKQENEMLQVVPSTLQGNSGVLGAAYLALQKADPHWS